MLHESDSSEDDSDQYFTTPLVSISATEYWNADQYVVVMYTISDFWRCAVLSNSQLFPQVLSMHFEVHPACSRFSDSVVATASSF